MINERRDIVCISVIGKQDHTKEGRNLRGKFRGQGSSKSFLQVVRDADEMWIKFTAVKKRCLSRQAASNWESAVSAT